MDRQGYLEKLAELNESLERRSQMADAIKSRRLPAREAESPADRVRDGAFGLRLHTCTWHGIGLGLSRKFSRVKPEAGARAVP